MESARLMLIFNTMIQLLLTPLTMTLSFLLALFQITCRLLSSSATSVHNCVVCGLLNIIQNSFKGNMMSLHTWKGTKVAPNKWQNKKVSITMLLWPADLEMWSQFVSWTETAIRLAVRGNQQMQETSTVQSPPNSLILPPDPVQM